MTAAPDFTRKAYQWVCVALGLTNGNTPFPWQENLLSRFSNGVIDRALEIPTGLGKTSVMAIWLVARACGANIPRRLLYVVDRRAVVDQATDVALELRKLVDGESDLKKALGLRDDQSLPISTLRGQYVDNREWLEDPAAPAIIVGTVDMVGSRLLFEGYGVSSKMRPYHAGLLGADTLVVLDEAHLVPPFEHLLAAVETGPSFRLREKRCQQCIPRFRLLALSATGRTQSSSVVGLTKWDLEHEVVKKRLSDPEVPARPLARGRNCGHRAVSPRRLCTVTSRAEPPGQDTPAGEPMLATLTPATDVAYAKAAAQHFRSRWLEDAKLKHELRRRHMKR